MSNTQTIIIKQGYPNGTLDLSDGGRTKAKNKDFINWTIKKDIDVTTIEKIEKKSGDDIFKTLPHSNGTDWIAEIKDGLPKNSNYEYSITWNGKFGRRVCDPKITVNPSGGFSLPKLLIGFIVSLFLAFLSFRLLKRNK